MATQTRESNSMNTMTPMTSEMRESDFTDPMTPKTYRIERLTRDLRDTFTLELLPEDAGNKLAFAPGQFNMLYQFGVGEVPISISGDADKPERLVHTIRAVGTVTSAMARLKKGATVGVRGPFGSSWPVAQAEGNDIIIVAGGIGLAPLRPAIYHVLSQRERYGRFVILYGARTPKDILYRRELERWSARLDVFVDVTVDQAAGPWRGDVGVVTHLVERAGFDPHHATAMVCGPEIMMRYAVQALNDRGLSDAQIYVSLERNMKCAIGFCGHCQLGSHFICRDGPVFSYDRLRNIFMVREL